MKAQKRFTNLKSMDCLGQGSQIGMERGHTVLGVHGLFECMVCAKKFPWSALGSTTQRPNLR